MIFEKQPTIMNETCIDYIRILQLLFNIERERECARLIQKKRVIIAQ